MLIEWRKSNLDGWRGITTLENVISKCESIKNRRSDEFLYMIQIVHDIDRPHIIQNYELITKDMLTFESEKIK